MSRGLAALPHDPPLVSAPDARLIVSWWNCELRIWRVKPQQEGGEKPKVVARLALKGDENITSTSITRDGTLLAVSTANEVKLFQLLEPKPVTGSGLRIRKLELPWKTGARLVRLQENGKWLAVITATNDVQLARIVKSEDITERPRILSPFAHLDRLPRDSGLQDPLNGPWGRYNRSITHAKFSDDGAIFAAADLAGFIDSWVLEGHEDSTAPEVDIASSSVVNDDESDDDYEAPAEQMTFFGQRWIRNPSSHLFPRLDSSPLLLSFQPGLKGSSRPEPNGNPAVHPTRHNPHPHSQYIPDIEHSLLVVSADNQLYHFEVLAGRLSEWSRRNPKSSYPPQFQLLDNPVKGCTWDVTESRQRVWLYGEKWLFMFDLAHDLPLPGSIQSITSANEIEDKGMTVSKKRKRASIKEPSKKSSSGAGGAVPVNENVVTKLRKFNNDPPDTSTKSTWIELRGTNGGVQSDDDAEDKQQALATSRRPKGQDGELSISNGLTNGHSSSEKRDTDVGSGEESKAIVDQKEGTTESWWHTFKYRPILGIVPIGGEGQPHEVVLVERPSWDLDLGPRFVGSHE